MMRRRLCFPSSVSQRPGHAVSAFLLAFAASINRPRPASSSVSLETMKDLLAKDLSGTTDAAKAKKCRKLKRSKSSRSKERYDGLPAEFANVSEVIATCGMVGHVTPKEPFAALFRQHWSDFEVTEMPTWGHPLSRDPSFDLPKLPSALTGGEPAAAVLRPSPDAVSSLEDLRVASDQDNKRTEVQLSSSQALYNLADNNSAEGDSEGWWLEFILRKQHVPHAEALKLLAKLFDLDVRDITVAGIKDFVGDTVQRVRIRNVAAGAALDVNELLQERFKLYRQSDETDDGGEMCVDNADEDGDVSSGRRRAGDFSRQRVPLLPDAWVQLSDFSYHERCLQPGHLAGNHFRIVLRDVEASTERISDAAAALGQNGFQNFFGTQRFSWFRGLDDLSLALLQGDWVRVFYGLLDTWETGQTARNLLQRQRMFPLPIQNVFRRRVVKVLREETKLKPDHFVRVFPNINVCPPRGHFAGMNGINWTEEERTFSLAVAEAFRRLPTAITHLASIRFACFLWNLALSARFRLYGRSVLVGDFAVPKNQREALLDAPPSLQRQFVRVVTHESLADFTIHDVVHPSFGFHGRPLPENAVGSIYRDLCAQFGLSWETDYRRKGVEALEDGFRLICIQPGDVRCEVDSAVKTATIEFMLPRGCYATVALREMMGSARCANAEVHQWGTRPDAEGQSGRIDPAFVETLEDIYKMTDYQTGEDNDSELPPDRDVRAWEMSDEELRLGPDPANRARDFADRNFRKAIQRREDAESLIISSLFDEHIAANLSPDERRQYAAGHSVPRRANSSFRTMKSRVMKRTNKFRGLPREKPQMNARDFNKPTMRRSKFELLSKDMWNTWS